MSPDDLETLLNPRQAAVILGTTPSALAIRRSRRRGPAWVKIGARVYYRPSQIQAYIESCEVVPGVAS